MKHLKTIILSGLLMASCSIGLFAQQGNVAAGGSGSGTGGSFTFSIGQPDFQTFSSAQGSISLGLQQVYTDFFGVPDNLVVPSSTIADGDALCFNALETITTGGNGNHFIVEAGGSVDLIAGQQILLKPGTSVILNGRLHARISNDWCQPQPAMLASASLESTLKQETTHAPVLSDFFRLFPNPTTGIFTLELTGSDVFSDLNVEIYSTHGRLILKESLPAQSIHTISISDAPTGIYLVRVIKDNVPGFGKIIKQ
jgi:hypothetical protein